ncbi:DHA2 family efflux MFS transporter permease subunit [Pseudonocardia spinosispora]|uniref:DHA2 family efflux MFS transporter permease subunit n=1 Tax=Pseudonocardia spinosispora TaxID=103441 RepID=UPI0006864826|nr:DHA2 family efflux MFS transporter permease subunit [Pseudonocardia spinosispora]
MLATATPDADRATQNWLAPLLVLMVGSFLPPMDSAIVNVAIPHIQKDLGGGSDDVAWISTAFSLGLAVFVPTSNWLANRLGPTLLHRVAMIGFLLGSTLCGLAWDLNSLIAFRVLAAIPGSIVPVVTISMIYQIVPKDKIGAAMGLYGLGVAAAPSCGPTIGGLLVEDLSWRWIFHFKTPIGIAAVLAGLFLLPRLSRGPSAQRFDWWGFLTFGYGLAAIIVVSSKGQKWHWDSYLVMILAASAVVSLALFAVIENEVEHPLIDLRLFRCWPFINSLLLIGVLMISLFATMYYLPQFLQSAQGLTAHSTGMVLLPMGLMMVVLVPLAGVLYDKFGPRLPALIGLSGSVLGAYLLATGINVDMTRTEATVWVMVAVLGGGLGMMPIMTNGLNWLPPHLVGYGGAMNNVVQRVASALGVAIMGILVSRVKAQLSSDTGSLQTASTLPQYQNADQAKLLGLYKTAQLHVQAMSYADMFIATGAATGVGVLLVLMLKKPPPSTPQPAQPTVPSEPVAVEPDDDVRLPEPRDRRIDADAVSASRR